MWLHKMSECPLCEILGNQNCFIFQSFLDFGILIYIFTSGGSLNWKSEILQNMKLSECQLFTYPISLRRIWVFSATIQDGFPLSEILGTRTISDFRAFKIWHINIDFFFFYQWRITKLKIWNLKFSKIWNFLNADFGAFMILNIQKKNIQPVVKMRNHLTALVIKWSIRFILVS
jgi:hypothetical protein